MPRQTATCQDGGAWALLVAEGTPLIGGKVDLRRTRATFAD